MQNMTTFLFFAIGLLAFVQAFPSRGSVSSGGSGPFTAVVSKNNKKNKAATDAFNQDLNNYVLTKEGLVVKGRNRNRDFLQRWSENFFDNHVYDPDTEDIDVKDKFKPNRDVRVNSLFTKAQIVQLYLHRSGSEANAKNGGPVILNNVLTEYNYKPDEYLDGKEYEVKNDNYRGSTDKVWQHVWVGGVQENPPAAGA